MSNNKPSKTNEPPVKKSKRFKKRRIFLIIIVLLVVIRLFLPYIVLHFVNKKLAEIDGYYGHVEDIDLFLIAGSYKIKDIKLEKTGGKIPVPFFSARVINLSVEWKALFKGSIVGEIEVDKPIINFVKGPTEETSQTKIDKEWQDVVDDLMPLKINRFEVTNGEVHYRDFYSSPKLDMYSNEIYILAENLSNASDTVALLPSTVKASASIYSGKATMNMKLDALNKVPTFDLNAELKGMNLVELNEFLKAYGKFDVQKGTISVYAEAAAKDGNIAGYTKPIIKDLDVVEWKDEKNDSFGQKLKETLFGFGGWVFSNKNKDQVATEIQFEGKLDNPDISLWNIIGETLRNAFIKALYPALENKVNISTVNDGEVKDEEGGFLKKIFDGKKNDDKKDKK